MTAARAEPGAAAAEGTLEERAADINARWHVADRGQVEARIEIGKMLLAAKEEVEQTDISWPKWCARHIERSMSDINRVIALARADDPLAALEEARAIRRQAMAELRSKRSAATKAVRAHVGADEMKTTEDEEEEAAGGVRDILLDDVLSTIPLDRLCFASFREEIIDGKRVAILSVPAKVDEGVQVAVIKHLCAFALPGTRKQIRQWFEGDVSGA